MFSNATNYITEARAATNKAIAAHDLETLMNHYSDDITIVRGDGNIIHNKTGAEKTWRKIFTEQPNVSFVRNPIEIIVNDNQQSAWEKGNWAGSNTYSSGGNYAAAWCFENGQWKIRAELFVAL